MKNRIRVLALAVTLLGFSTFSNAKGVDQPELDNIQLSRVAAIHSQPMDVFQEVTDGEYSHQLTWGWPHPTCVGGWALFGLVGAAIFCDAPPAG